MVQVPSVEAMYDALDWSFICESPHWTGFHGDFHGENIIVTASGDFKFWTGGNLLVIKVKNTEMHTTI